MLLAIRTVTLIVTARFAAPVRSHDGTPVPKAAGTCRRRIAAGVIPTGRVVALIVATLAGALFLVRHHADALAEAAGADRRMTAVHLAATRAIARIATALAFAHFARDHEAVTVG